MELKIDDKLFIVFFMLFFDCNKVFSDPVKKTVVSKRSCESDIENHKKIVDQFFEKRKNWKTSNLGSIIYKNIEPYIFNRRSKSYFNVLLWNFSEEMKQRYTFSLHDKETLDGCSVKNCAFFENPFAIGYVDVIVTHVNRGPLPPFDKTNSVKRWILLNDDPPVAGKFGHACRSVGNWNAISNIFNWTMTYRSDSDIPVPYGRTIPRKKPIILNAYADTDVAINKLVPNWDDKQMVVIAVTLITECKVNRNHQKFIDELSKHMKINIQDMCNVQKYLLVNGKAVCTSPGCKPSKDYLFFIVLESVSCRQFLSEKIFSYAYDTGSIPVIMGPPLEDCEKLLPPGSFLHVESYKNVAELATHMLKIARSPEAILSYHTWRKHFIVTNEHGYFDTRATHYCRICEGLNYNDGESQTYDADELRLYFDEKLACDLEYSRL